MSTHVAYRMFNKVRNCGDAINPYVIEAVSGLTAVHDRRRSPHVLAVGSLMHQAGSGTYVWGTGILNPAWELAEIPPGCVRAVRGKLTASALRSHGCAIGDVPLGDPGIFAERLINAEGPSRYRVCVVPHYASAAHPTFERLKDRDDICVVNMHDDSLLPLTQIAASEVVISQSLHGLIFAEALGKPSVWISETEDSGWTFKFRDWFSVTRNPQAAPMDLQTDIDELARRAELRVTEIDMDALAGAFPFEAGFVGGPILSHTECLELGPVSITVRNLGEFAGAEPAHMSEEDRDGLRRTIKRAMRSFDATRAFPTYLELTSAEPSDHALLGAISDVLDKNTRFPFATIVTTNEEGDPVETERCGLPCSARQLIGTSIVVRPNRVFDLDKPFLTVLRPTP